MHSCRRGGIDYEQYRYIFFSISDNVSCFIYFAIFCCTKMSPGLEAVMTDGGTRESEQPIQRVYSVDLCQGWYASKSSNTTVP